METCTDTAQKEYITCCFCNKPAPLVGVVNVGECDECEALAYSLLEVTEEGYKKHVTIGDIPNMPMVAKKIHFDAIYRCMLPNPDGKHPWFDVRKILDEIAVASKENMSSNKQVDFAEVIDEAMKNPDPVMRPNEHELEAFKVLGMLP